MSSFGTLCFARFGYYGGYWVFGRRLLQGWVWAPTRFRQGAKKLKHIAHNKLESPSVTISFQRRVETAPYGTLRMRVAVLDNSFSHPRAECTYNHLRPNRNPNKALGSLRMNAVYGTSKSARKPHHIAWGTSTHAQSMSVWRNRNMCCGRQRCTVAMILVGIAFRGW